MKALIGAFLVCALVTPALAADEFYVVRDTATKKCTIVDKKPTVTTTTVVGDKTLQDPQRGRDWNEDRQSLHGKLSRQ